MKAAADLIPRIRLEEMPLELQTALRPRVERLGYLGEFFQCAAHQPAALHSFMRFTQDLRSSLPDNLTEVVALTVATRMDNGYERSQHERLCLSLGFTSAWVREVIASQPHTQGSLTDQEKAVQKLVTAVLDRQGHGVTSELETVAGSAGAAAAIAILFLTGRYVTHSLMVSALGLRPPVASIFQEVGP